MPLFGIAVIEQPTKKEREDGKGEKLLFGPKYEVGVDGQAVAFRVLIDAQRGGELPADLDMSRAQVLVSPFV